MAIERRQFLGLVAATWLSPARLGATAVWSGATVAQPAPPLLLSCRSDLDGHHWFSAITPDGDRGMDYALPARGHGMAIHPRRPHCAVFARRPGDFIEVVDLESATMVQRVTSPPDRHFYGHGVYHRGGSLLFVGENDFDRGVGRIGIYAADDHYRRIGELPSHGIGPHELA